MLSPKHVGTAKVASKRWLTQTVYEDTRRDTNKTNANPKSKPIRPSQPLVHFARFVSYYSCCVCETFSRIRRELYWAQLRETFARFLTMILVGCCTRLRVGRGHPALTAKPPRRKENNRPLHPLQPLLLSRAPCCSCIDCVPLKPDFRRRCVAADSCLVFHLCHRRVFGKVEAPVVPSADCSSFPFRGDRR